MHLFLCHAKKLIHCKQKRIFAGNPDVKFIHMFRWDVGASAPMLCRKAQLLIIILLAYAQEQVEFTLKLWSIGYALIYALLYK